MVLWQAGLWLIVTDQRIEVAGKDGFDVFQPVELMMVGYRTGLIEPLARVLPA